MSSKFKLTNVALYAKNWYGRTDDIWSDLNIILKADDYEPYDKGDVYRIIESAIMKLILNSSNKEYCLQSFLDGLNPNECWKCGYFTSGHKWAKFKDENGNLISYSNDYDFYEAYVRSALSLISVSSREDLGWDNDYTPTPNKDILPKKNNRNIP